MWVRQVQDLDITSLQSGNRGIDRHNYSNNHDRRQADAEQGLAKEETTPSSTITTATSTTTSSSSSSSSSSTSTSSLPARTTTTSSSLSASSSQTSSSTTTITTASSAPSILSSLITDSASPTSLPTNGTVLLTAPSDAPSTLLGNVASGNSTILALPTGPTLLPTPSADASSLSGASLNTSGDDTTDNGLSSGAKAGIAVGSIAGACIIVVFIFAVLRIRRGSSLSAAFMLPRRRKDSWSSHGVPHLNSDGETVISGSNASIKRKSRVMVLTNALPDHLTFSSPKPSVQRPGTAASQRPLVYGAQALGQISEEPESPTIPEITRPPNVLHIVNGAPTSLPSTPGPTTPAHPSVLIPAITRQTPSPVPEPLTLAPRTPNDTHRSPAGSPLPQYLKDAAFSSSPPKSSRFSWTNSGAPKTPLDHARLSTADSTTSSVPRYRTVDSWCGAQATRLGDRPVQEHLRQEIEAELQGSNGDRLRPTALNSFANNLRKRSFSSPVSPLGPNEANLPYPSIPTPVSPIKEDSNVSFDAPPAEMIQLFPNPQLDKVKRQEKCQTLLSDITVFKAHPGTLVTFPNENRVPSAILDEGLQSSALH